MRAILSAIFAIILLAPANARATEISFRVTDGELPASFGLSPFTVTSPFVDPRRDGIPVLDFGINASLVNLVSGPLLDVVVDPALERTIYTYGPGTLNITASWNTSDGTVMDGSFAGTVLGFQLFVCEGCDSLFHASLADDLIVTLGPGLFDDTFAHALGVFPVTTGGAFLVGLEDIDGDPATVRRVGFSHTGSADLFIEATPVPEPSLLLLGLTFGGVMIARRRHASTRR